MPELETDKKEGQDSRTELSALVAEQQRANAEQQRILQEGKIELCGLKLDKALLTSNIPDNFQKIIRSRFSGKLFEDSELATAISELKEAVCSTVEPSGVVQPQISLGTGEIDKFKACMDLAMGYKPERDKELKESEKQLYRDMRNTEPARSIKALHSRFHDDHTISGRIGPNALLRESTTSDFATMLGNSMGRSMVQEYQQYPDEWRKLVAINENVNDFRPQTRIVTGGFSGLALATESDTVDSYREAASPGELSTSYQVKTRGLIYKITRAIIKNDDMGYVLSIPRRLGRASAHEVRKFAYGLIIGRAGGGAINTDTTYDGRVIYHAAHGNAGTSALSQSAVGVARTALKNQKMFAALFGEPIRRSSRLGEESPGQTPTKIRLSGYSRS